MAVTRRQQIIEVPNKRLTALEAQVASLQAEMVRLQAENTRLQEEIVRLQTENTRLQEENTRLEAENAELRRRLGLNSHNSHKPPRSDGYRKKRVQPALPKGEKRPRGGQPGHPGRTLRQVEKPDRVCVHLPERCAICGREISTEEPHSVVGRRQVFDIPEPKLEVTEHRLGWVECCGQKQYGEYPAGVNSPVQYGPGVRALAVKLSVDHKMPLEQICLLFADLYGYELNTETVERALEEGFALAAPMEAEIREQLKQAAVAHFDETGLRVNGRLCWLHTASDARYTHLFVHPRRGEEALRVQIRKILQEDETLAAEIARLWGEAQASGVTVTAAGNRSVAIGGNVSGSVIVTGDKNKIER